MTDKEIIKAKELIKMLQEAYTAYYDTSKGMPYNIDEILREGAFCLENCVKEINRQQAELDDLKRDTIPKLQEGLKRANKYGLETDNENEQLKAEIERLKHEREVLIEDIHHSADQINEQIEEIERLIINMNAFGLGIKREKERADTIRAEAIKEFAERLNAEAKKLEIDQEGDFVYTYFKIYGTVADWCKETSDNIVKEMVGEDK